MNRRQFLAVTATSTAALSGCGGILGGGGGPVAPPRESDVFEDVSVVEDVIEVTVESDPMVESIRDFGSSSSLAPLNLGGLGFIGVASAAKGGGGGKGATGRGDGGARTAPTSRHLPGSHKYYGRTDDDDYDDWEDDHRSDITQYDATITRVGVTQIGNENDDEDNLDEPGAPDHQWEKEVTNPSGTITYTPEGAGWYRVGARVEPANADGTFSTPWESVDIELEETSSGYQAGEVWKVSPRFE